MRTLKWNQRTVPVDAGLKLNAHENIREAFIWSAFMWTPYVNLVPSVSFRYKRKVKSRFFKIVLGTRLVLCTFKLSCLSTKFLYPLLSRHFWLEKYPPVRTLTYQFAINVKKQPPEVFYNPNVLKISQNSKENTCVGFAFLIKLQTSTLQPY